MAFAPPVSRGNFYYHDGLYVDVGNLNRHKRASVEEIRTILRPDLKKSKNAPLAPPKDQVGHWYEAQLMHYGLPPSKDKARAKMRLLEALNSSRLAVPPNIAQMEAEMKKQYAAAERKAKAEIKSSNMSTKKGESLVVGKKRKQAELSANSSFGNEDRGTTDAADPQQQTKKAKKAQPASTEPKTNKTTPVKPSSKSTESKAKQSLSQGGGVPDRSKQTARRGPIQTARSSKLHAAWLEDPSRGPGPVNPATGVSHAHPSEMMSMGAVEEVAKIPPTQGKATKKETRTKKESSIKKEPSIKKEVAVKKESTVKKEPSIKKEAAVKKESTVKKEPSIKKEAAAKREAALKKQPSIKNETPIRKEPKPKKETKVKNEPSTSPSSQTHPRPSGNLSRSPNQPSLGLINGIYDLSCQTVVDEWDRTQWNTSSLTLTLTLDGTTVWGAYDLGMFSGILFLPNRPWQASNSPLPFTWRGRENGEGEMDFGDQCVGEISFLGNGAIEGWISVYGRCCFEGRRREEAGTAVRTARSMREEWEGYNEEAYEEERVGRW